MEKDAQVNETSGLYYKIKSTWTQAILIFKLWRSIIIPYLYDQ